MSSRRQFVRAAALALAATVVRARAASAGERRGNGASRHGPGSHPTPRPGIDASKILPASALPDDETRAAFDDARAIPQVLDGIRCHCNCGDANDKYSLLSCFEKDGMAQQCEICQGQARMARRMVRLRRSLEQIRATIDERYAS